MLDIIIDNELASDYGITMVTRPVIPTAKQDVEFIKVPGRHGSLTKKGAYEDVPFQVTFNLLEEENIKPLIRRVKSWLMKGKTLSFTDDEVYRKIKHVEVGDIINEIEEHGEFEVDFTLDPFEYMTVYPIEVRGERTIMNQGTVESAPKFELYGNGDLSIIVNDVTFQMKDVKESAIVDSDLLLAYSGSKPLRTIGEFPVFQEGENKVRISSNVNRMSIDPRWRYK